MDGLGPRPALTAQILHTKRNPKKDVPKRFIRGFMKS